MARVLVTGGTGFIGRALMHPLSQAHEVYALARSPPPQEHDVTWIEQDLTEPLQSEALPGEVDTCIHMAQSRRYREFPGAARDIYQVNIQSTFELLEFAETSGAARFIHLSSGSVYARSPTPLRESSPATTSGFYAASKRAAEAIAEGYSDVLVPIILRPFVVYGPGQRDMLIPSLLAQLLDGGKIQLHGDPGFRTNPIFVSDAVRAILASIDHGEMGTFNIASDEAVTLRELVELMGEVVSIEPTIEHTDNGGDGDLVGDNTRMREVLGVEPKVALREGLARVAKDLKGELGSAG